MASGQIEGGFGSNRLSGPIFSYCLALGVLQAPRLRGRPLLVAVGNAAQLVAVLPHAASLFRQQVVPGKGIGPHIAKSSGKSRQARGRRRRNFSALLPTQGAAYASRHV